MHGKFLVRISVLENYVFFCAGNYDTQVATLYFLKFVKSS